jgi:hypothetical protein
MPAPTPNDQLLVSPASWARAYGFRELKYFKLKILAIREARYVLVG